MKKNARLFEYRLVQGGETVLWMEDLDDVEASWELLPAPIQRILTVERFVGGVWEKLHVGVWS